MKFTDEQITAINECRSVEELIAKAAEAGCELSADEAQKLMELSEYTELDCEDLEVAGGACTSEYRCRICDNFFTGEAPHAYRRWRTEGHYFLEFTCETCYQRFKDDPYYDWDR